MTELGVAWAAGILEGEGCFSIFKRKNRPNSYVLQVLLEMTDEDIIRRVADVFDVGTVILRSNQNNRTDQRIRKPTWVWSVQNKAGIALVIKQVLPYLGKRRTEKAKELLAICE